MRTRTAGIIALILFCTAFLFHFSAKRQPTEEEKQQFDFLRQPAAWQGRPAPELTLDLLNGEKFVLSEHVGKKAIVLNFFATWCGPCKEEMPELVRFAEKHKDEPFVMIGIDANESADAVRDFLKYYGVTYPVAIDKGAAQKALAVRAFPTTVFIGADGTVQLYEVGPIQNADVAFEAPFRAALAAISAGTGITKEAFLRLQRTTGPQVASAATMTEEKKTDPEDDVPPGRAREIAEKMNCPCGCTHKLMECTCKTSKDIKAKLKTMDLAGKTDAEVITALNKEFCMK
ncbi:MAG: redoxin family protein [Nitrospirota bacterium]